MNAKKQKNMMAAYTGFVGPQTIDAINKQIPQGLRDRLTGAELGAVMDAVSGAYHNGRASLKGLDICDDCVWIPWGGGIKDACGARPGSDKPEGGWLTCDGCPTPCAVRIGQEEGRLVPIAALRAIKVDGGRYTMDYKE